MITTLNTAVTENASEILGNIVRRKKNWITEKFLDLCEKRTELRKKRFEPEGSEKYKNVNNNLKRCMKKGKKVDRRTVQWDWRKPGEEQQWEGIPTSGDLTTVKQKESYYYPRSFRKMPQWRTSDTESMDRRTNDTESMDRILLCAVQSQDQ